MEINDSSVERDNINKSDGIEIGVPHWPVVVTCLILLAAYALQGYLRVDPNHKLPRIGSQDLTTRWTRFLGQGSWDMYKEGYQKVIRCRHFSDAYCD